MEGTEATFARLLESAAMGASVHESIRDVCGIHPDEIGHGTLTDAQNLAISDACCAATDVALEILEQGLDPDDLDPSWLRLRRWMSR